VLFPALVLRRDNRHGLDVPSCAGRDSKSSGASW
jgi:hypothetical protein